MNKLFPECVVEYVRRNAEGRNSAELTRILNRDMGTSYTVTQINSLRYRIGAKSGIDGRIKSGSMVGAAYRFPKGHVPANKGRTWDEMGISEDKQRSMRRTCFKKGGRPHNYLPLGSEVVRDDGYLWRKIAEPNKWKQVHVLLWEEKNGPVPEGMCLTFLDGDRLHVSLDNLMLISLRENRILNSNWDDVRKRADPDLAKAGIALRRIDEKIRKIEEGMR